jgi:hypothetical protein
MYLVVLDVFVMMGIQAMATVVEVSVIVTIICGVCEAVS